MVNRIYWDSLWILIGNTETDHAVNTCTPNESGLKYKIKWTCVFLDITLYYIVSCRQIWANFEPKFKINSQTYLTDMGLHKKNSI